MKAQVDVIFGIVLFFAVVITFVIVYYVNGKLTAALKPVLNPTNSSNSTVAKVFSSSHSALTTYGDLLVFVYFAIGIAAIIAAFFVDTSPIFFILAIFVLAIQILIAAVVHNVFFDVVQQSSLISSVQSFPALIFIFEYFPEISFVIALLVVIALYAKG
ncbi:MAG: hypothetical protein QW719_03065 [Candidatus Micrarchaeaceae archaeon]